MNRIVAHSDHTVWSDLSKYNTPRESELHNKYLTVEVSDLDLVVLKLKFNTITISPCYKDMPTFLIPHE